MRISFTRITQTLGAHSSKHFKVGKLLGYGLIILVVSQVLLPKTVMAHDLVTDTSGKVGTILHFTPGDDPIAGQTTGIYYEVDGKTPLTNAVVTLVIRSDSGGIVESIPVEIKNQSVSAAFNFPIRGLYYLELSVTTNSQDIVVFDSTQRITQSLNGSDPVNKSPTWAKAGLVFSVWVFILLLITGVKRRKLVIKQSR